MNKKLVRPKNFPQKAWDVWESVYNANKKKVGEERAAKIAWAAVKKGWKKVGEKWVRKQASELKVPNKFYGSTTDLVGLGLDPTSNNSSEIEILKVGNWEHPIYGELIITEERLKRFKENFDLGIRKGVAIDVEHKSDEGAVGWVKNLTIKDDSLFALVEWTNEGIQLIRNKKFRFFSPEFDDYYEDAKTGEEFRDVLIGGAITNRPFLQDLQEVVLSENSIIEGFKKKGGEDNKFMKKEELKEKLLADPDFSPKKEDKVSDKMLSEVKEEIASDKKLAEEKEAKKKAAEEKKKLSKKGSETEKDKKVKTISLTENQLDALETAAEEGRKALREVRNMRLTETLNTFVYSEQNPDGVLLPKSKELAKKLLFSLGEKQRKTFTELLKSLPKIGIFSEVGVDLGLTEEKQAPAGVDKYSWTLSERAKKLMSEDSKKYKTFRDAIYVAEKQLAKEGIKAE